MSSLDKSTEKIISLWSSRIKGDAKILKKAKSGDLSQEDLKKYINNLYYIFLNNTDNLTTAIHQLGSSHPDIKMYFENKYQQEYGHHNWALDDIKKMKQDLLSLNSCSSITIEILNYIKNLTTQDPVYYLAYIMAAEKVTVDLSEDFLSNCQSKCGIDLKHMSSITKHVDADKGHDDENSDFLKSLNVSTIDSKKFEKVANDSCQLIYRFLDEVLNEAA